MPVSAKNVLNRVQIILQDAGAVRWPLTELVDWLNDGLKEIAFLKPSATSTTTVIPLAEGTYQAIPDGYASLIRVICNVSGDGTELSPYTSGRTVTPIVREILDQQKPNWHDGDSVPFRALARHVVSDIADPTCFYVYPGNDGTGKIRATLSRIPAEIAPGTGDDPDDIETYDQEIPELQSIYQQCLIDYVLAMAFSKDMQFAGAADRAQIHYAKFSGALASKQAVEAVANTNTTNSQPNS